MYNVTRRHRRSITVLILITALSVSACTAPRAWEMNKTQTAHEKNSVIRTERSRYVHRRGSNSAA